MIKKLIGRFLQPRHYWRDLNFDELSELYTSNLFRSLSMSLVGIFIPIYLYQLGFPVWQIFIFFSLAFFAWSIMSPLTGYIIAKVGPKHTILASYVFQVISMMMLVTLEQLQWPLLGIAVIYGVSNSLYICAINVGFSKVKHKKHGGKEVGWLYMMDRLGAVTGPIIGGLIAYFVGAEYIFLVAIALLFIGIVPLFLTAEPTATNQKLDFKGLKVKDIKSDLVVYTSIGVENWITIKVWPFFLALYVFSDNPYIKLGSIMSISVLLSIFLARAIGSTIDKRKGRSLLRIGATANAVLHLFRPFTGGYPAALGVNLVNEAVTPAYRMPFFKGLFEAADDLPGHRIVYIITLDTICNFFKGLVFAILGILALVIASTYAVFFVAFIIGAIASLGIMTERFKALDSR